MKKIFAEFTLVPYRSATVENAADRVAIAVNKVLAVRQKGNTDTSEIVMPEETYIVKGTYGETVNTLWGEEKP